MNNLMNIVLLAIACIVAPTLAANSGSAQSGDFQMNWTKVGQNINWAASAGSGDYFVMTIGANGSHGAEDGVCCDKKNGCTDIVMQSNSNGTTDDQQDLQNVQKQGGNNSYKWTKALNTGDGQDYEVGLKGDVKMYYSIGNGDCGDNNEHRNKSQLQAQELGGPKPPTPPVPPVAYVQPTPPLPGGTKSCSTYTGICDPGKTINTSAYGETKQQCCSVSNGVIQQNQCASFQCAGSTHKRGVPGACNSLGCVQSNCCSENMSCSMFQNCPEGMQPNPALYCQGTSCDISCCTMTPPDPCAGNSCVNCLAAGCTFCPPKDGGARKCMSSANKFNKCMMTPMLVIDEVTTQQGCAMYVPYGAAAAASPATLVSALLAVVVLAANAL